MAKMGVFGLRYPADQGGSGGNTTLFCITCEELARGLMSLAAITAMQCLMGTNFLFHFGTDEMRKKYFLPAMKGEKVACFCLTEPEAGSDLGNVSTLAQKTDDGYRLNGMKTWVTNGPVADFYTVLMQTDPKKKFRGLNFFFVPRDTPGFSNSKAFDLLGTRTTPISEIAFKDCLVPHTICWGPKGGA
jgi:alkylation response protein AidB-like acyl-CoA dehydrogenase